MPRSHCGGCKGGVQGIHEARAYDLGDAAPSRVLCPSTTGRDFGRLETSGRCVVQGITRTRQTNEFGLYYDESTSKTEATHSVFGPYHDELRGRACHFVRRDELLVRVNAGEHAINHFDGHVRRERVCRWDKALHTPVIMFAELQCRASS